MAKKKLVELDLFAEQEPAAEHPSPRPPARKRPAPPILKKPFVTNFLPGTPSTISWWEIPTGLPSSRHAVANNPAFATTPFSCSATPAWGKPI